MDLLAISLILAIFCSHPLVLIAQLTPPVSSHITVVGAVYCDVCLNDGFSRNSYFISGADVHIQCKFNANSPKTSEMITFAVNRTTDIHGAYKLDIPTIDGVDCVDGPPIQSFCQASLLGSSSSTCNVPSLKATTTEITVKSKQENLCVYCFSPLSYRTRKRNHTLCSEQVEKTSNSYTSISEAAKLQSFPFPFSSPPPSFPFPFPFVSPPPSLPFPFPFSSPPPSLPFPFSPIFQPPPPPAFSLGDPKTWFPHIPLISPPPPPPPPPAFDLRDPRTWTPIIPPFSPPKKQNP